MTEVPEHLLKKAAEARARLTGEGGDADAASADAPAADAAPASTAPVPAAAAVPAEPEPEPEPVPDSEWVAAAKARKTIPVWVMPVLLFLPIWAVYYVGYLERPPVEGGLAVEGEEIYASAGCAGCHGGGGGGGTGRQLNEGEVLLTFPAGITADGYDGLAGQIAWVANGSNGTVADLGGPTYGDSARPGGAQVIAENGAMAGFASGLTTETLGAVVFHERSQFGNMEPDAVIEELELIEEWIHVMEEEGIDIVGVPYATVHETLETAREHLAGG